VQSALDPKGDAAAAIAQAHWIMLLGAVLILALVTALTLYAVYRDPQRRAAPKPVSVILAGGVFLPIIALTGLLAYGLHLMNALHAPDADLEIRVIGHQWWWELRYPGKVAGEFVTTANELRVPAGRPVNLILTSEDVIHSFWVPSLAGKMDLIPGHRRRLTVEAAAPGIFRGQCAEFCGAQHAHMALHIVALPEDEFERWLAQLREPAREMAAPGPQRGRDAFVALGCIDCHTVRGHTVARTRGPELTHVATRAWLGAGTLPTSPENLAAWITSSQRIKPGNAMLSYPDLDPGTLASLVDYLWQLE